MLINDLDSYLPILLNFFNLILNSLLALAAIGAAIFAGLTLRQAQKFNREERQARRAYLAPNDDPGFLRTFCDSDEDIRFSVQLINYGVNPTSRVECKYDFFDDIQKFPKSLWGFDTFASNPIPHGSQFKMELTKKYLLSVGIEDISVARIKYIVLKLKYYDIFLSKELKDTFCWQVKEDKLNEVNFEERKKLINLIPE
jgi:hypothetical protein